jgi:uncharacterized membrane protein YeaQ/YmgE (transglycosylase-associated protein family)
MNIIIYLMIAIVVAWLVTDLMHDRPNLVPNMVVAVVAVVLVGFFLAPRLNVPTISAAINFPTFMVTFLGEVFVLVIFYLSTRGHR